METSRERLGGFLGAGEVSLMRLGSKLKDVLSKIYVKKMEDVLSKTNTFGCLRKSWMQKWVFWKRVVTI